MELKTDQPAEFPPPPQVSLIFSKPFDFIGDFKLQTCSRLESTKMYLRA